MPDITMFDFNSVKVVSVKKQRRKSLNNPHIPIPWLLLKINGQNHVSLTVLQMDNSLIKPPIVSSTIISKLISSKQINFSNFVYDALNSHLLLIFQIKKKMCISFLFLRKSSCFCSRKIVFKFFVMKQNNQPPRIFYDQLKQLCHVFWSYVISQL